MQAGRTGRQRVVDRDEIARLRTVLEGEMAKVNVLRIEREELRREVEQLREYRRSVQWLMAKVVTPAVSGG